MADRTDIKTVTRSVRSDWKGDLRSEAHVRDCPPFFTDEPKGRGGLFEFPTPAEYIVSGLAGCSVAHVEMFAKEVGMPVEDIHVDGRLTMGHFDPDDERSRAGGILGIPVLGAIEAPGTLEGGDFLWFDERTCAVADGYRTNPAGIRQLAALLGPEVHVEVVPLPHFHGPGECLHLMSIISPLDADLAAVYSPLMTVPFRNWLLERGIRLVEVPDEEYGLTMGCNVLALAPRKCLAIEGSPITRARLEAAGCEVIAFKAEEISLKGGGGPTCLTRPLLRG